MAYHISQGRVETPSRRGGQFCCSFVANLLQYLYAKDYRNIMWFDKVIAKIEGCNFLPHSVVSFWTRLILELVATQFAIDAANQHSSSTWRYAIAGTNSSLHGRDWSSLHGRDWSRLLSLYIMTFQRLCYISSDHCIVWTIFLHSSAVENMS